jgi:Ca2+-binding RTX toxin-like protein
MYGEAGDDVMFGGAGNDTLWGDAGNDYMFGEAGVDDMKGGWGDDFMRGGDDTDYIDGGEGRDSLYGDNGDDWLTGGNDNDYVVGGQGNDFVFGDAGDDTLVGAEGQDILNGGTGRDILAGGLGRDTMTGGADTDTFLFSASDIITQAHPTVGIKTVQTVEKDTITDFNAAQGDRIDLMQLLDNLTGFAGGTAQDAISQGYLYWATGANGTTTVYLDRNGHAADSIYNPDIAVVDLLGVNGQISADQFIGSLPVSNSMTTYQFNQTAFLFS